MFKTSLSRFSLVATAIALTVVSMPSISVAKDKPATMAKPATEMKAAAPKAAAPKAGSIWEQMNLTTAQKNKIQGIRSARTKAINAILNKDQQAKYEKLRGTKTTLSAAMQSLGLNGDQSKKVSAAAKKATDDLLAVLDSKQKSQLSAYLKQQKGAAAE
jgi:Spy/CpxP family protein refolding chaperone